MNKTILIVAPIALLFACGHKPENTIAHEKTISDTLTNRNEKEDSTFYLGFASDFYFSDEAIVYTELYFDRALKSWKEFDSIAQLSTKVIYQDDENSRNLMPEQVITENFDICALDQMWFFDSNNIQIGSVSRIKSFEYLEQNISPVFIATYEIQCHPDEITYCIGGKHPNFSELNIERICDKSTIKSIQEYFDAKNVRTDYTLNHDQYKLDENKILTFSNTDDYFFIHLTDPEGFTTSLYESEDFSNLIKLQIVPLLQNDMPALLCQFYRPETDLSWSEVFVFKQGKYVSADRQRI